MNEQLTHATKLNNISLKKMQDKNGTDYYIIFDANNNGNGNNGYFCFEKTVKTGWTDLFKNWENIKEVELEYVASEKGNKVINLWSDTNIDEFLI